ncbi:hypothetical protein DA01_06590 [Dehalococcoides mccartyi]|uniref:Uncharacterized protein n=1 Tax=Dehalococcoides mccartyi TaxID=61435 RepID=A0A0V8M0H5_9CHLR|nr:hypothetical protein [Dehalococcoides mccartyi]KSV17263.1 hypothetical protein DA01_06590 [Dehalococcoides mccartyi]
MGGLFRRKDNYTIIAENTAKYYLALKSRYSNRLTDCFSLFAATVATDTQVYLSLNQISTDTILHIVRKALGHNPEIPTYQTIRKREWASELDLRNGFSKTKYFFSGYAADELEKDTLFNLVFELEIEIFSIDSPEFNRENIEIACYTQAKNIYKTVKKVLLNYKGEPIFAVSTSVFMDSSGFASIREQLGIN